MTYSYAINQNYAVLRIGGECYRFRRYRGDVYHAILESIRPDGNGHLVCDLPESYGGDGCPINALIAMSIDADHTFGSPALTRSR